MRSTAARGRQKRLFYFRYKAKGDVMANRGTQKHLINRIFGRTLQNFPEHFIRREYDGKNHLF